MDGMTWVCSDLSHAGKGSWGRVKWERAFGGGRKATFETKVGGTERQWGNRE